MTKTTLERNKELVLEAFDTLFNKRLTTKRHPASGPKDTSSITPTSNQVAKGYSG